MIDLHPVNLADLKLDRGFWYLGSPYSLYPDGMEEAFRCISAIAGKLMRKHVPVFCPISHAHPIAEHGGVPPTDHDFWIMTDTPMMQAAHGLLVAKMRGWEVSRGLEEEIAIFTRADKPVHFLDPWSFEE